MAVPSSLTSSLADMRITDNPHVHLSQPISTNYLYAVAVHEPGMKPRYLSSYDESELPLFTDRTASASLTASKVVAMLDCTELQEWYPHARIVTFIAERVDA